MTEQPEQQNPNELLSITREELERCCSQMSAAGYKVSANYVEASVLSRSLPAPSPEHYNGVCAIQDKCNDYSDFIESIEDELNPDDEDPVCPIKCKLRMNPESLRTGGEPR